MEKIEERIEEEENRPLVHLFVPQGLLICSEFRCACLTVPAWACSFIYTTLYEIHNPEYPWNGRAWKGQTGPGGINRCRVKTSEQQASMRLQTAAYDSINKSNDCMGCKKNFMSRQNILPFEANQCLVSTRLRQVAGRSSCNFSKTSKLLCCLRRILSCW